MPIDNVLNLSLGIYCQTAGNATMSISKINAPRLSKLHLKDKTNGIETDLMTSNYSFNLTAGIDDKRFVITAQHVLTYNKIEKDGNGPNMTMNSGKLFINNLLNNSTVRVYDVMGRLIAKKITLGSILEILLIDSEMYIVQIENRGKTLTRKLINRL